MIALLHTRDESIAGQVIPATDGFLVVLPDGSGHYFAEAEVTSIDELEAAA